MKISRNRDSQSHFAATMSHVYPTKEEAEAAWMKLTKQKKRPYEEIALADFKRYHRALEKFYHAHSIGFGKETDALKSQVAKAQLDLKIRSLLQTCQEKYNAMFPRNELGPTINIRHYAKEWRELKSALIEARRFLPINEASEMILTLSSAPTKLIEHNQGIFTTCIANLAVPLMGSERDVLAKVLWQCAQIPCIEVVRWFSEKIGLLPLVFEIYVGEPTIAELLYQNQDNFQKIAHTIHKDWDFPTALKRIIFRDFLQWIF